MFNQYPYINENDLNLDYILKSMRQLKEIMDEFITLNSVTFADPITWNISTQYARNTIVIDPSGNAYLSKEVVPAGVQLNNADYWLEIFNFTAYTRTANQNLTVNVETNTTRATAAYNVDDWLIWNDVLYKVTSAIAIDDALIVAPNAGANIVHFTVEDFIKAFMTWATNTIQQYKLDIDASELLYRQQLAGDIATTTASLQAQLDAAIAGVTVDSEVINARIGADGVTYSTLGEAIRTQDEYFYREFAENIINIDNLKSAKFAFNNNKIAFKNGRYSDDGTIAYYNTTDTPAQKSVRCASINPIYSRSCVINSAAGYQFTIYVINSFDDATFSRYVSWQTKLVVSGLYYITVRKTDDSAITPDEARNAITITELGENKDIKSLIIPYEYGGFSTTSFNNPITENNSNLAANIRLRFKAKLPPCTISVDSGYSLGINGSMYNDNYMTNVTLNGTSLHLSLYNAIYCTFRKTDDSTVTIDDLIEHVHITPDVNENKILFEAGGYTTLSTGYVVENNSVNALSIRMRGRIFKTDTPIRITAKNGYKFGINFLEQDANGYMLLYNATNGAGNLQWLDYYECPANAIIALSIKKPDDSTVISCDIDSMIEIDYDYTENPHDRYKNIKVLYIGDSITENNYLCEFNWTKRLYARESFESITNTANGGCGIVTGGANSWYNKIDNITDNFDLILIMGNMNDYSSGNFNAGTLGTFGDRTLTTQYGAVTLLLEKIMTKWPLAKIGWITSTPRQYANRPDGELYGVNSMFYDADSAIKKVCANYSIPVLDLFNESNFRVWDSTYCSTYFYNDGDCVHPNDAGNEIMTRIIQAFVTKYF